MHATVVCSTQFTNRDAQMISPYGRYGKGIGFADRPVEPAVARPCEPHGQAAVQDRSAI
jgi:hypothetical protein